MNASTNNTSSWKHGKLLLASSTSPLESRKSPAAIPYFMKQTTWSLWPVFKTTVMNAICDGLNNLKETLGF